MKRGRGFDVAPSLVLVTLSRRFQSFATFLINVRAHEQGCTRKAAKRFPFAVVACTQKTSSDDFVIGRVAFVFSFLAAQTCTVSDWRTGLLVIVNERTLSGHKTISKREDMDNARNKCWSQVYERHNEVMPQYFDEAMIVNHWQMRTF